MDLTGSKTGTITSIVEKEGITIIGIAQYCIISNEGGLGHLLGKEVTVNRIHNKTKGSHWTADQTINYKEGDNEFRCTEEAKYPRKLMQNDHNLADWYQF